MIFLICSYYRKLKEEMKLQTATGHKRIWWEMLERTPGFLPEVGVINAVCPLNCVQLTDVWEVYTYCVHLSHVLLWILQGQDQNLSHFSTLYVQHYTWHTADILITVCGIHYFLWTLIRTQDTVDFLAHHPFIQLANIARTCNHSWSFSLTHNPHPTLH